jgi:hypothetical protein
MNPSASDFRDTFQNYIKLSEDLSKIIDKDCSKDPQALVQSILQNRDSLDRIVQMNGRVVKLTNEWRKRCVHFAPQIQNEIRDLIVGAQAQAIRLQTLCSLKSQLIQETREGLGKELEELRKGARYLKSLKPGQHNYPKFIDSSC